MKRIILSAAAAAVLAVTAPACAEDAIITYKSLAPDTALDLAKTALQQCRKDGFQVAVVVIDRFGVPLVMLRDRFAGSMATTVATNKASTSLAFSQNTSELGKRIQAGELSSEYRSLPNVVTLGGGMVIQTGGSTLGGVGVSGAPGGDKDEACAKAGLDSIRDKLDF